MIARVPFDEGSLAGAITCQTTFAWNDFRRQYFAGERKLAVCRRIQVLLEEALPGGEPLATAALRFCLSHRAVSTVIPGSRDPGHVAQNLFASKAGVLPAETLDMLTRHRWHRNFYI